MRRTVWFLVVALALAIFAAMLFLPTPPKVG